LPAAPALPKKGQVIQLKIDHYPVIIGNFAVIICNSLSSAATVCVCYMMMMLLLLLLMITRPFGQLGLMWAPSSGV
jgi:hypothetical protein